MLTILIALSFVQPADACAMPRFEAPLVAKADAVKAKNQEADRKAAAVPVADSLEAALAEIDSASVIPEIAAPVVPAAAPPSAANRQAASVVPTT